jgi:hypothetical protein
MGAPGQARFLRLQNKLTMALVKKVSRVNQFPDGKKLAALFTPFVSDERKNTINDKPIFLKRKGGWLKIQCS